MSKKRRRLVPHFTDAMGEYVSPFECGMDYVDGHYRIAVEWSFEDGCWLARFSGCDAEKSPVGTGDTREMALCDLACSLACLADALHGRRLMYRPSLPIQEDA